jgi:methionyl aminopeptidase
MINRNDPCWCQSGKKWKKCHYPKKNPNRNIKVEYFKQYGIIIKDKKQIVGISKSCKLAATILDKLCNAAKIGVTTNELDKLSQKLHKENGAIPAPLGYGEPPFPKTICTSLNEVICHGIPNDIPLKDGDIINIDVTCILDGYYGDCSRMVCIGKVSDDKKLVVDTSYECMMKSIEACAPGVKLSKIGQVIEDIATPKNCSVVNQFVGHGVGVEFHEHPQIPFTYNDIQIELVPGMTFTIEPMINAGIREAIIDPKNHWEARTRDLKPSAQWEHTILITDSGFEILTKK